MKKLKEMAFEELEAEYLARRDERFEQQEKDAAKELKEEFEGVIGENDLYLIQAVLPLECVLIAKDAEKAKKAFKVECEEGDFIYEEAGTAKFSDLKIINTFKVTDKKMLPSSLRSSWPQNAYAFDDIFYNYLEGAEVTVSEFLKAKKGLKEKK